MKILLEGWQPIPFSFSLVQQALALEWLKMPGVQLLQHYVPYLRVETRSVVGLFTPEQEQAVRSLPAPTPFDHPEVTVRFFAPFDFRPDSHSARTFVWGKVAPGVVPSEVLQAMGVASLADPKIDKDTRVITCSDWSKQSFVRSGFPAERIDTVPVGFDPQIFQPAVAAARSDYRRSLGLADEFVFLHVGLPTREKGLPELLKMFATVAAKHPNVRLFFKGQDVLAPMTEILQSVSRQVLTKEEAQLVQPRFVYFGQPLSTRQLAGLYAVADAYVSPYLGCGFNLPCLEAAASGLPVICTQGGATDEFTTPDFCLPIKSTPSAVEFQGQLRLLLQPDLAHGVEQMERAITDADFRARARAAGPEQVREYTWAKVAARFLEVLGKNPNRSHSPDDFFANFADDSLWKGPLTF